MSNIQFFHYHLQHILHRIEFLLNGMFFQNDYLFDAIIQSEQGNDQIYLTEYFAYYQDHLY